jgi:hypothetical protein
LPVLVLTIVFTKLPLFTIPSHPQNMAATVRDIKAADFIQKVTTATTPFNAAASTRLLPLFFCVLVPAFVVACFPLTLPLQFSEHLKKTGKVPPPSPFHCHRPSNAARHASHATGSRPRMG